MTLIVCPTPTGDPRGPHRGDVFLHVKSRLRYVVLSICRLEAEDCPAVLYTLERGGGEVWCRAVSDWFAEPRGDGVPRFAFVSRMVLP